MSTEDGRSTSAVVIFFNMLTKSVRDSNPTHVRVLWDDGRSVFRTALYPQYKAKRKETNLPPYMADFLAADVKVLTKLLGMENLSLPGVEADDLIAVSQRVARETLHEPTIIIVSADKDMLQLVGPDTEQIRVGCVPEVWHAEQVLAKFGVDPDMLASYLALVGDVSDSVPGVSGIGPKKAVALLEGATTFDAVLDRLETDQGVQASLSHALVCLNDAAHQHLMDSLPGVHEPLAVWSPTMPGSTLWPSLCTLLNSWEMHSAGQSLQDGSIWSSPRSETVVTWFD